MPTVPTVPTARTVRPAELGRQALRHCIIEAVERELLAQAIQQAQGNQSLAARWLGISRLTLREKLQRFGLRAAAEP